MGRGAEDGMRPGGECAEAQQMGLRMKDEGWRMKDEGWRMEDGGWRMEGLSRKRQSNSPKPRACTFGAAREICRPVKGGVY
jgi:hypothetical protein